MRVATLFGMAGVLALAFGCASPSRAGDKPKPHVELKDEGLALQEVRPLDRHVYILTLDGKWSQSADVEAKHYINFLFANGGSVSHRVQNEAMFCKGEVRCVLIEHELLANGVANGGDFLIVISEGKPVDSATAADAISEPFKVSWPVQCAIVSRPVRTRHSPPRPVDSLPMPDDALVAYPPVRPK